MERVYCFCRKFIAKTKNTFKVTEPQIQKWFWTKYIFFWISLSRSCERHRKKYFHQFERIQKLSSFQIFQPSCFFICNIFIIPKLFKSITNRSFAISHAQKCFRLKKIYLKLRFISQTTTNVYYKVHVCIHLLFRVHATNLTDSIHEHHKHNNSKNKFRHILENVTTKKNIYKCLRKRVTQKVYPYWK